VNAIQAKCRLDHSPFNLLSPDPLGQRWTKCVGGIASCGLTVLWELLVCHDGMVDNVSDTLGSHVF
jgi:hypothetical protein